MSNTHSVKKIHTHTRSIYPELYNYTKYHTTKCFSIVSTALENILLSGHANSSILWTVQEIWGSSLFSYMTALRLCTEHLRNVRQMKEYFLKNAANLNRVCPNMSFLPVLFTTLLSKGPGAQTSKRSIGSFSKTALVHHSQNSGCWHLLPSC